MYRKPSWKNTEKTTPKAIKSFSGMMAYHKDEISSDSSQKKAAAMRIMIRTGSLAIVKTNRAKGGPKAMKVQPKNSGNVIFSL